VGVQEQPLPQKELNMTFTIDIDNDITAHASEAQAEEASKLGVGTIVVRSEKELAQAAAEWPASRLVALWNSFAGVAPFPDCQAVKKFETRDKGVARLWAAIQRLGNTIEPRPAEEPKTAAERASQGAKPAPKGKKAAGQPGTHKAQVIAMIQRRGGASLEEIRQAMRWQKHTVRGFISMLGSQGGMKITSRRRERDGARVYEA